MTVGKPLGGKTYMICLGPIPADEYKIWQKVARSKGMNTEEYCVWCVRKEHVPVEERET